MQDTDGKSVSSDIRRALHRLSSNTSPELHIQQPGNLAETLASSLLAPSSPSSVTVEVNDDSVIMIDSQTSSIISKTPKQEAYKTFIAALKSDHARMIRFYDQTLSTTRRYTTLAILSLIVGLVIVAASIVALMFGALTNASLAAITSAISGVVTGVFLRQAHASAKRLERHLKRLLEEEGYFRALTVFEYLPDGVVRQRMLELIVLRMLGIERSGEI